MGLEPVIALLMCVAIVVGVRVTRKHRSGILRDLAFEQWCASGPMLFALKCDDDAIDAMLAMRRAIGPSDELFNFQGNRPWPHYRLELRLERFDEGLVAAFVVRALPRAPKHRRNDAIVALRAVFEDPRAHVAEVWLHGQLFSPQHHDHRDRDRYGWRGARSADGGLELVEMIGRPAWLPARLSSAA